MKGIKRRDFLKLSASGAAIVSVPQVFGGCARQSELLKLGSGAGEAGYFENFGISAGLINRILGKGLSRGADFSEIYLQHSVRHAIGMEDGSVNRAGSTVDLGAGIRVLKGDATGYAYSEDLSEQALLSAAATAAAVADGPARISPAALAAVRVKNKYFVDEPWSEISIDRKLPILVQAEEIARAYDPRITKVGVRFHDETSRILVADSDGRVVEDDKPMTVLVVFCTAKHKGMTETSAKSCASRDGLGFYSQERIGRLARDAADYTVRLFDAKSPPPGEYPVVLAPALSGILLHEAIGHGMEADFNRKKISIYTDRIGKRVAQDMVTIIDDGDSQRLRGSMNIDDEGTKNQKTVLVENGILRSYMHDKISARHYKVGLTGSGRRQSFRFPPTPRMRTTYMLNGPHDPEEIIGSVKKGLYAEYFRNGQVFIGAGDFTFYLKHGRMIEDGKLTYTVKDANLIGNGPEVLENIDMVGDDFAMYDGSSTCGKDGQKIPVGFGLPTVRCGNISIGGRKS